MTGRNPWAVLCVAEDAPYQDVQRAFRRRVKQTHPDGGGSADEFASVVQAFAAVRQNLPRQAPRETCGRPATRPTPYDGWLRPCRPMGSWSDDGGTAHAGPGPAAAAWSAPTAVSDGEFTAILHDEMAKMHPEALAV